MAQDGEDELKAAISAAKRYWQLTPEYFPSSFKTPSKEVEQEILSLLSEEMPSPKVERYPKLCKMCNKPMGKSKEDLAEMSHAIAFYYCKGHIHLEDKVREEKKKKFTDYWQ